MTNLVWIASIRRCRILQCLIDSRLDLIDSHKSIKYELYSSGFGVFCVEIGSCG